MRVIGGLRFRLPRRAPRLVAGRCGITWRGGIAGRPLCRLRGAVLLTLCTAGMARFAFALSGVPAGPVSLLFHLPDATSVVTSWIRV